jgi:hypothetical protein
VATTPSPDQQDAYAVVRLDSARNFTPRPENVSVRRVVHHFAEAELEVRHLNMTAPTGTIYFIQRTTVSRRVDPVTAPPPPAAAEAASPRPRKVRIERKAPPHRKRR